MKEHLKIVCISDTHGYHDKLNLDSGDILIHAGDFMTCGYKESEVQDFLKWFAQQNFEYKVLVAGNHDRYVEDYFHKFLKELEKYPSITYLEDSGVVIAGINFWGSPNQKYFYNWAFNRSEAFMEDVFNIIPSDTDILITHAPALGRLDHLENGQSVGERTLRDKITTDLKQLKFHIFGHIHNAYGYQEMWKGNGGVYSIINCSVVDEHYKLTNKPITIEYGYETKNVKRRETPEEGGEATGKSRVAERERSL